MSENATSTKRRNALLAAGAAAVLLLGGSTYALWSATSSVDGGEITAGDLDLKADEAGYWDVSDDRADVEAIEVTTPDVVSGSGVAITLDGVEGHEIDPGTWRIVPGDTVLITIPYTMVLEGDNLVAKLTLNAEDLIEDSGFDPYFLKLAEDITYSLYDADGNVVADLDRKPLPTSNATALGLFQAPNTGQLDGQADADIPYVNPDATSTVGGGVLALFVHFEDGTEDAYGQAQIDTATLGAGVLKFSDTIALSLQQVRCGAVGGQQFTDACS